MENQGGGRQWNFLANCTISFEPLPQFKLQTSAKVKSSNWQQALMEGLSTKVFYSLGIIYIFKSYFILSLLLASNWFPNSELFF